MIEALIYDMDGLLLDTEPLWGTCMLRVAQKHGIEMTEERLRLTTGLRIHEVTEQWSRLYPWQGSGPADVAEEILDDVIAAGCVHGVALPGVQHSLDLAKALGLKIALASSSPQRMINRLLEAHSLARHFEVVISADATGFGKPHPAVFLKAAELLGVVPPACCVLEDSINGMIAAKAARMRCIVIPCIEMADDPRFCLADAKLSSLKELHAEHLK